jgi:hypothetical protein
LMNYLIMACRVKRRNRLKRPRMVFKLWRKAAVTQTQVIVRGLLLFHKWRSLMLRGKRRFNAAKGK